MAFGTRYTGCDVVIQTQNFVIQPNGVIKGGSATYEITATNADAAAIKYSGSIHLKWPLSDRSIGPASYAVSANALSPASLQNLGDSITVGAATFKVYAIDSIGKTISVFMTVAGQPVSGYVTLDTKGQYFKILDVTATAKVPLLGAVLIRATPVDSIAPRKQFWEHAVDYIKRLFKQ